MVDGSWQTNSSPTFPRCLSISWFSELERLCGHTLWSPAEGLRHPKPRLVKMYSAYRVQYQLRSHKRDAFIEFCKQLLLTPFVLRIQPHIPDTAVPGTPNYVPGNKFEFIEGISQEEHEVATRLQGEMEGLSLSSFRLPNFPPTKQTVLESYASIWEAIEELVEEHMVLTANGVPQFSKLHRLVPSIGRFFTRLPLKEAFVQQNRRRSITGRRFVPPSFNDVRHVLNAAQIMAIASNLKLVTFDGDLTLYPDGQNFPEDSPISTYFVKMLQNGIHIAIVTAAGYSGPDGARKYEERLGELLKVLTVNGVGHAGSDVGRFFVMGGECNYLFRLENGHLISVPVEQYEPSWVGQWSQDKVRINALLDIAQEQLLQTRREMGLESLVQILRKERATGLVVNKDIKLDREQLDEFALAVQDALSRFQALEKIKTEEASQSWIPLPYCAFNGGNDVWVDVGNKLIGVHILRQWLGVEGGETLHIGDQFLATGNDISTRSACSTLWIASPAETEQALDELQALLQGEGKRLKLATLPKEPSRTMST